MNADLVRQVQAWAEEWGADYEPGCPHCGAPRLCGAREALNPEGADRDPLQEAGRRQVLPLALRARGHRQVVRAVQQVGFKEIGRRRQARIVAGRAYDVVLMDILGEEFDSARMRGLIA